MPVQGLFVYSSVITNRTPVFPFLYMHGRNMAFDDEIIRGNIITKRAFVADQTLSVVLVCCMSFQSVFIVGLVITNITGIQSLVGSVVQVLFVSL